MNGKKWDDLSCLIVRASHFSPFIFLPSLYVFMLNAWWRSPRSVFISTPLGALRDPRLMAYNAFGVKKVVGNRQPWRDQPRFISLGG